MFKYPQDSFRLMEQIMQVQDELDRFRNGASMKPRQTDSSKSRPRSKESKGGSTPKNNSKLNEYYKTRSRDNCKLNTNPDYSNERENDIQFGSTRNSKARLLSNPNIQTEPSYLDKFARATPDLLQKRQNSRPAIRPTSDNLREITSEIQNLGSARLFGDSTRNSFGLFKAALDKEISPKKSPKLQTQPVSQIKGDSSRANSNPRSKEPSVYSSLLTKANVQHFVSQKNLETSQEIDKLYKQRTSLQKENTSPTAEFSAKIPPRKESNPRSIVSARIDYNETQNIQKATITSPREIFDTRQAIEYLREIRSASGGRTKLDVRESSNNRPAENPNVKPFFKQNDEKPPQPQKKIRETSGSRELQRDSVEEVFPLPRSTIERKTSDAAEKGDLMNTIIDLKNKLHSKELEIIEMKNLRVKHDTEHQTLLLQIKDLMGDSKRSEELVEKYKQQIVALEREADILKKNKKLLEANKHESELVIESQKVKKLEALLEQREDENMQLHNELNQLRHDKIHQLDDERARYSHEIERLREELYRKDGEIKKYHGEIERFKEKAKEYVLIDKKIIELQNLQETIMEENDILHAKLKDVEFSEKFTEKDFLSNLRTSNKRLKDTENYSQKLMKILQKAIKGEEPPIECILQHNRNRPEGGNKQEAEVRAMTLKELCTANLGTLDKINKQFEACMNEICDEYACKYGDQCNVQ